MTQAALNPALVAKYNRPVPRYTSYPTVPYWDAHLEGEKWEQAFVQRFEEQNAAHGISLYIHLPFCESLCTYCGCNKKITTNHKVEEEYLAVLEKEWTLYRRLMKETPVIRELHLGGGTPTFFSAANLQRLLRFIGKNSLFHPHCALSIEGHPNNTTTEHLATLAAAGFTRISYGVQDNDPDVQRIINRIQPFDNVRNATLEARRLGFTSVNFDLIYGLPLQTIESIERTMQQVMELRPDRIAFYSYAHVPWTSRVQRLFDESHLPDASTKLQLYLKGKQLLLENGYIDIGMDHFALPHDELNLAMQAGTLHRNFMGYTTQHTGLLVGLGVSAISDAGHAYAQNEKTLHGYYETVRNGFLPVTKGYLLSEEDQAFRQYILDISCRGKTIFKKEHLPLLKQYVYPRLAELSNDELVSFDEAGARLTPQGIYFIRNVCNAFDLTMYKEKQTVSPLFSKAI